MRARLANAGAFPTRVATVPSAAEAAAFLVPVFFPVVSAMGSSADGAIMLEVSVWRNDRTREHIASSRG
jgi:hypothetical protein